MQTQRPAAPPPDVAPPPPPPPAAPPPMPPGTGPLPGAATGAFTISPQNLQVPRTEAEVQALRSRGSELSRQLTSVQRRRDETARDMRNADGANRAGLEQRLAQLDGRILAIEADIAANGQLLAAAPAALLSSTAPAPGRSDLPLPPGQITGISIVFTLFVLAPMALAFARRILRRPFQGPLPPAITESAQRLERLEHAVDSIAIEVERVSESQRFLTRILTEPPALGEGAAQPIAAREREASNVER